VNAPLRRGDGAHILGADLQGLDIIYVGDEFCQRRLPGQRELEAAARLCRERGLALALTTPYLTDKGVAAMTSLLASPAAASVEEVVVNDWGALALVREALPETKVTLGRLLSSHYMGGAAIQTAAPPGGRRHSFPAALLDLLRDLGVTAVEFNDLLQYQHTESQLRAQGLSTHLHTPYAFTTTSRYCSAAMGYTGYLRAPDQACQRQCEGRAALLEHGRLARPVLAAGNSMFMRQELPHSWPGPGPDRVIHNDHLAWPAGGAAP
jgi:hypothetical protein